VKKSVSRPQAFEISGHQVLLTEENGVWHVAVDQIVDPHRYESAADAWSAGVGEADRLDRAAHGQA
jgi:ureidoglycolate hydrolase